MSIRPTVARIDLAALRHNLAVVRQHAPEAGVCAVVKANAYGHGLAEIGRELERGGVAWLAVALVEEGLRLREAGVRKPILVMSAAFANGGYRAMLGAELVPALGSRAQLEAYAVAAGGRRAPFHLKLDTGMARLGLTPAELGGALEVLAGAPALVLDGVLTHFANADLADRAFNHAQLERFNEAVTQLRQAGCEPRYWHLANSAAVLSFPQAHGLLVRPGLMLYGLSPLSAPIAAELHPVMSIATQAVQEKVVAAGTRVSYGGRWTAPRPSRLFILPIGYADGYCRAMSGKAEVLVRGRRAPVVGTICMDLCLADVTEIPAARLGDEIVLLGAQGDTQITAHDWARWADTIPYEIVCGIQERVPRVYLGA